MSGLVNKGHLRSDGERLYATDTPYGGSSAKVKRTSSTNAANASTSQKSRRGRRPKADFETMKTVIETLGISKERIYEAGVRQVFAELKASQSQD